MLIKLKIYFTYHKHFDYAWEIFYKFFPKTDDSNTINYESFTYIFKNSIKFIKKGKKAKIL